MYESVNYIDNRCTKRVFTSLRTADVLLSTYDKIPGKKVPIRSYICHRCGFTHHTSTKGNEDYSKGIPGYKLFMFKIDNISYLFIKSKIMGRDRYRFYVKNLNTGKILFNTRLSCTKSFEWINLTPAQLIHAILTFYHASQYDKITC